MAEEILSLRTKLIAAGTVIILFIAMAIVIKIQYNMLIQQQAMQQSIIEFKKLGDDIARAQTQLVTKQDLETKIKEVGVDIDVIKKDLADNNAKLDKVVITIATTPGATYNGLSSNYVIPIAQPVPVPITSNQVNNQGSTSVANNQVVGTPTGNSLSDPNHYLSTTQGLNLFEPLSDNTKVPFGTVTFNGSTDKPWGYTVFPRKYYSVISFGTTPTGNTIAYSKLMIEDNKQQKYALNITSSELYMTPKTSQFYWWNPRLIASYNVGYTGQDPKVASNVGIQLFLSSYGQDMIAPRWSFFGLGLGYNIPTSKPDVMFSPFMFRIFPGGSMIQNVHIGPTIGMDLNGNFYIMAGLGFSL